MMQQDLESDSDTNDSDHCMLQCDFVGAPTLIDTLQLRNFYSAYKVGKLTVSIGDTVRVVLDDAEYDESDGDYNTDTFKPQNIDNRKANGRARIESGEDKPYGFGQVLAVYEDYKEEVFIELRWLYQDYDLTAHQKKLAQPKQNELFETSAIDDIAAGAVVEMIELKGFSESQNSIHCDSSYFLLRYMLSINNSLQKVSLRSFRERGFNLSEYKYAYTDIIGGSDNNDNGNRIANDPYSSAIRNLHISVIPDNLPCRDSELKTIENFIQKGIVSREAQKPVYISGMPGTGKTATVKATINNLLKEAQSGKLPRFQFIEINCLMLKQPIDAYSAMWRQLTGYNVSSKKALAKLKDYFFDQQSKPESKNRDITVCLVDELDFLITKDCGVLYNFFSWPSLPNSSLIFIGIANTTNLPEQLSSRVKSRLDIFRIVFKPYSHTQVQEILTARLSDLNLNCTAFTPTAIEFMARKAANVAGDLRIALKICQRTIELLRTHMKSVRNAELVRIDALGKVLKKVKNDSDQKPTPRNDDNRQEKPIPSNEIMSLIKTAVDEYKQSPFIASIIRCCLLDKAIIIIMSKHRRNMGGGDEFISTVDTSMTLEHIWIKLEEFIHSMQIKISTAQAHANISFSKPSSSSSHLKLPPKYIFVMSINRLLDQAIIHHHNSRSIAKFSPLAKRVALHASLSYSDIMTAIKDCVLHDFC